MEHMDGGSLTDILPMDGTGLEEPQIALILKDVLSALDFLFQESRLHRNIMSDNILLTKTGYCKLCTFCFMGAVHV
jgi:serine/threonine protein kinase